MKNWILTIVVFLSFITIVDGQKNLFVNLDTANFNNPDFDLMKRHGFKSYSVFEFVNDSMIFKSKFELNYEDSTMYVTNLSKRNKPKSNTIPMYEESVSKNDTSCCPYVSNEYDTLNRIIKRIETYPYSMNKLKIIYHFTYVESTSYLNIILTQIILHDLYVNSTLMKEFDYKNILIGYERSTYITERNNQMTKTYLKTMNRVNNDGLLIFEINYDQNGDILSQYKYSYE